jgi:endonuclease III
MSTRRTTRASAAALKELDTNTAIVNSIKAPAATEEVEVPPKTGRKRAATTNTQGNEKRRMTGSSAAKSVKASKPAKTTKPPIKGGWALPHGMGSISTSADTTKTTPPDAGVVSDLASIGQATGLTSDLPTPETNNTSMIDSTDATPSGTAAIPPSPTPERLKRQTRGGGKKNYAEYFGEDSESGKPSTDNADAPVNRATPATRASVPKGPKRQTRGAAKKQSGEDSGGESDTPLIDVRTRVKRGADNIYGLTRGYSPYRHRFVPTKDQCEEVHRILTEMHGEVKMPEGSATPSLTVAGCGNVPSVLDALLRTLISGNTLMANADMAVQMLVKTYGVIKEGIGAGSIDWKAVRLSSTAKLSKTIHKAGCPNLKAKHIKSILDMVYEEQKMRAHAHIEKSPVPGAQNEDNSQKALEVVKVLEDNLSLDHMYAMSADEAITEFLKYPGIGVKTAACVVLFCLRIPCFAVDTHVHKFCKWLGWVPQKATELDSFNHGEFRVPDHLKYGLHQLFIRHGQVCFKCRKVTRPGTDAWNKAPDCPLEHLLDRSKDSTAKPEMEADVKVEKADNQVNNEPELKHVKPKKKDNSAKAEKASKGGKPSKIRIVLKAGAAKKNSDGLPNVDGDAVRPATAAVVGGENDSLVTEDGVSRDTAQNIALSHSKALLSGSAHTRLTSRGQGSNRGRVPPHYTDEQEEGGASTEEGDGSDHKGDENPEPMSEPRSTRWNLRPRRKL